VDDLCADRELLAALRQAVADDRDALAAAGPPPTPGEVLAAAAELGVDLGAGLEPPGRSSAAVAARGV
jgi:hypothetical protein